MSAAILKFLAISLVITAAIPLILIASQPAKAPRAAAGEMSFAGRLAGMPAWPAPEFVTMRDGYALPVRRFGQAGPLLVLVHGSGWHGQQFAALAPALGDLARIVVPDLRGHGAAPERRGDVDYIGQFEDDLADLIARERQPGQKVILLGHSSGGGVVVRHAGGADGGDLDAAILLAPFLHHRAPTSRPNSGGWAQPLVRRLIGLSMLNMAGITALNHLTVMQFSFPDIVLNGPLGDTATRAYSYRLNTSYAPRNDYLSDVAALPPFTLIAGAQDEAFLADQYAPVMRAATTRGAYHVLPGIGHLDLVDAPAAIAVMRDFLADYR